MNVPAAPRLEAREISRSFPGVRALSRVSFSLQPGEVLALLGENGAGKSTLMKILAGVQRPDEGEIRIDGRAVRIGSVQEAQQLGIALIHQELNLVENLDLGANLYLGREPLRWGLIDKAEIRRRAQHDLAQVGLTHSPDRLVGSLSIGQQQLVEIARALAIDARILIMDEPTSSLSAHETERLFDVIEDLRRRGVSIIYISHRLGEVQRLADRAVVLRDGCHVGELSRDELTHEAMVRMMVGRDVSQFYQRQEHPLGETVLEVENLRTLAWPEQSVSFSLCAGEIVGLAGLVGAGRTELVRALFGADRRLGGTVRLSGKPVDAGRSAAAIAAGLALAPEDRKAEGVIIELPIDENLALPGLSRNRRWGLFRNGTVQRRISREMIDRLRIRTPSPQQLVRNLSGGNQQKVVLGKWLALSPQVLLLDEPTRGVDVGAKQEIYRVIEELAAEGMAILFVSSEMTEILGLADRVLVMHEGRLAGERRRSELTEESILHLATGGQG